ncbi:hypothetical protein J6590_032254 [Homalodisca vitripennis]|nr:hypothetical protein J6590_032254 [Homalodisca vitripennis]
MEGETITIIQFRDLPEREGIGQRGSQSHEYSDPSVVASTRVELYEFRSFLLLISHQWTAELRRLQFLHGASIALLRCGQPPLPPLYVLLPLLITREGSPVLALPAKYILLHDHLRVLSTCMFHTVVLASPYVFTTAAAGGKSNPYFVSTVANWPFDSLFVHQIFVFSPTLGLIF